jgi:RimJ/RimL family protein N-acetyltransferase
MASPGFLWGRARGIYQTQGLLPLLGRGFKFLKGYFFHYGTYYLYEYSVKEGNAADFIPRVRDFTFKIVTSNQQADELAAHFLDLSLHVINVRHRLNKGAIAFCFIIGGELAYVGWVAMTEEAKKSLTQLPIRVGFSNNEAYTGAIFTNPKYRRMGLMAYAYCQKLQFLRERGRVTVRAVVATNNVAVQQFYASLGARRYAEARYLKILWWGSWRETPITGVPESQSEGFPDAT